jgi:hypothetical protein
VRNELAKVYKDQFGSGDVEVRVVGSVGEAVQLVRNTGSTGAAGTPATGIASTDGELEPNQGQHSGTSSVACLITGSLKLIGSFLEVLEA